MKIDPDDFEEVLLEFVRGDAPISTLDNVGILVTFDQNLTSTTITIKSGTPLITIGASLVLASECYLEHRKRDKSVFVGL